MYVCVFSVIIIICLSVSVFSLGKKLTRQEDQKHIFNFVWPNKDRLTSSPNSGDLNAQAYKAS